MSCLYKKNVYLVANSINSILWEEIKNEWMKMGPYHRFSPRKMSEIKVHVTRLMLPKINEAGVPVCKNLFVNYLNWLKQSQRSETAIAISYQKLSIHFYSKNGDLIIKCSITKLDIVNIIVKVTIRKLKTRQKLFVNIINILYLSIKKD